jgi:lysophospholipase L1-like esterase
MRIIKPHQTLLVLLSIGLCFALVSFFIPVKEIGSGWFSLKLPSWNLNAPDSTTSISADQLLALNDSLMVQDSAVVTGLDSLIVVRKISTNSIQFPNDDSSPMFGFFESLDSISSGQRVHVMHYGDSQIEVDHCTRTLREKLQEKFGGNGPGLISPLPVTANANIKQNQSENWKRYTAYGYSNKKSPHNRYGVMCAFARFTAERTAEQLTKADSVNAWIELKPYRLSDPHCPIFNQADLFLGNHKTPFRLRARIADSLITDEVIAVSEGMVHKHWNLNSTPSSIKFEFDGRDSPDVYAAALGSAKGVEVSNIALRGNDGLTFSRVNGAEIKGAMEALETKMVILQFGGNALPLLSSDKEVQRYCEDFQAQIKYMRSLSPNSFFLIIGPSDMSTKINGVYQTRPRLEALNDGLKKAAFAEGCAFWDMYQVMGGNGSMINWVKNSPPYAGPDYTHFTKAGAAKIAEVLFEAIVAEYDAWKLAKNPVNPTL